MSMQQLAHTDSTLHRLTPTAASPPPHTQVDASDIVRTLFMKGVMLSMNQQLDKNTVKLVAQEYELLVVDKDEDLGASAKKKSEFNDESDVGACCGSGGPCAVAVGGPVLCCAEGC